CYNALGVYNASDDDETNNGATQCSNGADDDGDSLIDWPQDPQCTGVLDDDESALVIPACSNGIDDDSDGHIDYPFDPGCQNSTDTDETNPVVLPACSDGVDNDLDGLFDLMDPGCTNPFDDDETDPVTTPQCSDTTDNDGDSYTDYPFDPGCSGAGDDDESDDPVPATQCSDGIDNDGDSFVDFPDDIGCDDAADNDESNPAMATGQIIGYVVDFWAGNTPIENATVTVVGPGNNDDTNANGFYLITGVSPGSYTISADHPLYPSQSLTESVVAGRRTWVYFALG
ncbi:hypothetical protein GF345_01145, partial [Candidatus Woesearchaeota archaeon]|nr:hypothetical protein [Candidatus Woesearchaeota archaeon]